MIYQVSQIFELGIVALHGHVEAVIRFSEGKSLAEVLRQETGDSQTPFHCSTLVIKS